MCLLLESIKIFNGRIYNADLHQKRMHKSIQYLFGLEKNFILNEIIDIPDNFKKDLLNVVFFIKRQLKT